MRAPLLYTGCALDRAAHRREDAAWLDARLADGGSRIVPVWRNRSLVAAGEPPTLAAPTGERGAAIASAAGERIFLGCGAGGEAWFAADLSAHDAEALPALTDGAAFVDLRRIGPRIGEPDGSLLAYARAIVYWHHRHRFCGRCGRPTTSRQGGHVRVCTDPGCATEAFPRTDPVVIMLVEDRSGAEPRCLLARQPSWPRGLVSALAGFVEPGEPLEAAVVREVREEVGLEIGAVRYCGSQPWPFPCSLMLGFRAELRGGRTIAFDRRELEDARWFDRAQVADLGAHGLTLPYAGTMARMLVEAWLRDPLGGGEAPPEPR